jgi:RNA polymerase sigma-70 factor (ECF subfamily)
MLSASQKLDDLMARVARGDRGAFADLYSATSAKLFGIIVRILRRRDVAEDVLQDVYVKIWQKAAEFDRDRASPVTWMATIARNSALDVARRRTHVAIDDAPEALEVSDPSAPALEQIELGEDLGRLSRCIEGLEPERREMVRLAYLNGLSREELGARFGHPVGTIKTWLHRSLKQLKDCLGG